MAETGRRTARHLDGLLAGSGAVHKAFRQIPFIIPITWQCTTTEPMQTIMGCGTTSKAEKWRASR